MTSKSTREENVQAVFDLKAGYTLGLADVEILKRVARMALAAMDSEPVAWMHSNNDIGIPAITVSQKIGHYWMAEFENVQPLYRHAQPAPVVPDDVLDALQKVARIRLDMNDFDGDRRGIADCLGDAEETLIEVVNRRAAMLNHPSSIQPNTGAAPGTEIKHPSTNSPVIPDGLIAAVNRLLDSDGSRGCYSATRSHDAREEVERLLAAAPQDTPSLNSLQSVDSVVGRWIPVSERMPEDRISVILWDAEIGEVTSGHYSHKTQTFYHCGDAIENEITHWMPPPCAPQEVK